MRGWTKAEEKLLGRASDKIIARRLKRSLTSIYIRRRLLGIPFCNPNYRRWTKREDRLLGIKKAGNRYDFQSNSVPFLPDYWHDPRCQRSNNGTTQKTRR